MEIKIEKITSKQNQGIKNLIHLQKHNEREKQNVFVVEGLKELEKAIHSGYRFESVYFLPELISFENLQKLFNQRLPSNVYEVTADVFSKIAYRENSGGIVALAVPKAHVINELEVESKPLFLVIEGVEKPGNIGAIYRTADAAGISGIIICDPKTDIYNPNTIRASLGCVFTVPTIITTSEKAILWLKKNDIKIYCTYLQAAYPYHKVDYTQNSAIVMGTEATGISDVWINSADANIIIPMRGMADSMNVSTSAAVVLFEACRQRDFL